jgi:hypothetical protein
LVLFLGAGASAPFDYPPTKPFLDRLLQQIPETTTTGQLLRSIRETKGVEDAEHIIQILDFIEDLGSSPAKKFFEDIHLSLSRFNLSYRDFALIARSLRDQLRTEVFRTYSWRPQLRDKFELYDTLFSVLKSNVLEVFTTNYDRVIEEYCAHSASVALQDGFVHHARRRVWEWDPAKSYIESSGPERILRLYKLHGSLNWRKTTDGRIEQVNPEERIGAGGEASYVENLLVYPGGKAEPTSEPFHWLYETFRNKMRAASRCLVIGFSFRDEYLDVDFSDFLKRENTKLVVISGNATTNLHANPTMGKSVQALQKTGKLTLFDELFEKVIPGRVGGALTAEEDMF